MLAAGVDAGTKSYRIALIDSKGEHKELIEIPTVKIKKDPEILVRKLEEVNADVYSGLSGYGLPVKHFSELSDRDVRLMTLTIEKESSLGLRKLIEIISGKDFEFYTIPAVIHLPSVPDYRKFCRIDMGTYDKLCSALFAMTELEEENFVIAEIGYGYSSVLAVENGKIVDGFGGSSFLPSYNFVGCLDSEVAYLLGEFPKSILKAGLSVFGDKAIDFLAENVAKGIAAMSVVVSPEKVFLSGRFAEKIARVIAGKIPDVDVLDANSSSFGAAIVSSAIAGGKFKKHVENAGIFSAKGCVLDYLPAEIRKRIEVKLFSRKEYGK